jgi:hypothetical protein
MHQTVKLATVGSIGDLGHIAQALGDADFNIEAIGGGESKGLREDGSGVGIITLLVNRDEDSDLPQLEDVLKGITLEGGRKLIDPQIIRSLDVEFRHDPGALAIAASALGTAGINIESILVVDVKGDRAVVSMAFPPGDLDSAKTVLENLGRGIRVLPKHGGRDRRYGPGHDH